MSGPWERYQSKPVASGPWERFSNPVDPAAVDALLGGDEPAAPPAALQDTLPDTSRPLERIVAAPMPATIEQARARDNVGDVDPNAANRRLRQINREVDDEIYAEDQALQARTIGADNMAERAGVKFWQRIRGMGAGGGRAADAVLTSMGFDPEGTASQWLKAKARSGEDYASRPVEGETTWEDVKARPAIENVARFILEQGASSIADMGMLASGAMIPAYVGIQAGDIGQQRTENNGGTDATGMDVLKAVPAATMSAALERLGNLGIFDNTAKTIIGRIVSAAGVEGLTETLQSGVEYAGSNLGTEAGFKWSEAGDQALAGLVAGAGMGAVMRGGIEAGSAVIDRVKRPTAPGVRETAAATTPITEADAASPIPTDLIAAGRSEIAKAGATGSADAILREAGLPTVGKRVSVAMPDGRTSSGVIDDAFDTDAGALGRASGVKIKMDDGSIFNEHFDDIRDMGVRIAEQSPLAEADAIDARLRETASKAAQVQPAPTPATGAENAQVSPARPAALDMGRMVDVTLATESNGQRYGKDGKLLTSPKGAQGEMQVMPGTQTDPGFGVTPARDNSPEELARVGRDYLGAMMKRYANDPAKAWAAYNAGPGRVDAAVKDRGGDWLDAMPAETKAYVAKNMKALGGSASALPGEVGPASPTPPQNEQAETTSADPFASAPDTRPLGQPDTPAPVSSNADIDGGRIDAEWSTFKPESGTLQIPRAEMPQIKAEHRGAMVNFLNARGVAHKEITLPASSLKPTQAEFSPGKVAKARSYEGGDRAILISSDGYVLDGHHQWMAKRADGGEVRAIQLDAPISDLLRVVPEFPSATTADGAGTAATGKEGLQVAESTTSEPQKTATQGVETASFGTTPTVEEMPSGKSVIIKGASAEQLAAIKAALPEKVMPIENKKLGGTVYSKKHEAKIRAALAAGQLQIGEKLSGGMSVADAARVARGASPSAKGHWPVEQDVRNLARDDGRYAVRGGAVLSTTSGRSMSPAPKWNDSTPRQRKASLNNQAAWLLNEAIQEAEANPQKRNALPFLRKKDPKNLSPADWYDINDVLFGDVYGPTDAASWKTDTPPQKAASKPKDRSAAIIMDPAAGTVKTVPLGGARQAAEAAPTDKSSWGSKNKFATTDAAEKARALLLSKMNQINSGFDPEIAQAGMTLMAFHMEAGARAFIDAARAVARDLGVAPVSLRNSLRSWYMSAQMWLEDNGHDVRGMDDDATVRVDLSRIDQWGGRDSTESPKEGTTDADELQGNISTGDAGAGSADVQRTATQRGDGQSPAPQDAGSIRAVPATDRRRGEVVERDSGRSTDTPRSRRAGDGDVDRVSARRVAAGNWRIEPGSLAENRSAAQKAADNISAIETIKRLDRDGIPANTEEQAAIARYVGWGGLKNAFPDSNGNYGKGFDEIGPRLRELLTDAEYDTARRSIQYAHYTSETIVRSMWDMARRLGFDGGLVFEPGMGTGNFAGMMPAEVAARTQYQGLEYDHLTSRIAHHLYPRWGVQQGDYTRVPAAKDAYDLVIGNPPFSETVVAADPDYAGLGFVLHDYFFAKSLDQVRPGGLLMFVTSAGTMNKVGTKARLYLAERADLVGAIRLPGNAFEENAGTSVTTDIVILRKRLPGEEATDNRWIGNVHKMLPDRNGNMIEASVNRYFDEHPEMILGEEGMFDTLVAGARYAVRAPKGYNLHAGLREAMQHLPVDVMSARAGGAASEVDLNTTERKDGSFYVDDKGRLMQMQGGKGLPVQAPGKGVQGGISAAGQERIKGLIPIRDALREVYTHDLAGRDAEATTARAALNRHYDAFVKKFGPINKADYSYRRPTIIQQETARAQMREDDRLAGREWDEGSFDASDMLERGESAAAIARAREAARQYAVEAGAPWSEGSFNPADLPDIVITKRPNLDPFMDDEESYRLSAIEHYNEETGAATKGRVFSGNAIRLEAKPQISSAQDALLHTMNTKGQPDIQEIARLAGLSESEVLDQLGDAIFPVPGNESAYQTKEQYLSGNVREKLRQARNEAKRDDRFERNVRALEAIQPEPLGPADIAANMGMPWLPTDIFLDFGKHLELTNLKVNYFPKLAQWDVSGDQSSAAATTTWGTPDRSAIDLISDALNRQQPKIYRKIETAEGVKSVLDATATQAAQDKVQEIKAAFREWIWTDEARTARLTTLYNENYNNLVAPSYDGSYLTTPGISSTWNWRPHQTGVISRIIQTGNTYMAHEVGAGKTSAMIGAGMEMKRLGLVNKPMYVVPNHMLGQFTKEFYEQYPLARIAVADERRFHTSRRKQFIANIAANDLDAVIITHSAFGYVPLSDDFVDGMIRQELDDYRDLLNEIPKGDQEQRFTRRRIEQRIEQLEQRLTGKGQKKRDQVFTFEETGVDFMFVDEAHLFRKLDFATKMGNVKGIDPAGSKMSFDLFAKVRYLETRRPNRSVVLASGTPITNTMAELFSVSRYLQTPELEARGLGQFDAWAGAYGDTHTALEQDPAGGYKSVTRFSKFVNVPELSVMVRQVMDVVTGADLEKYVTRPKLKGGKRQMVVVDQTDGQSDYQDTLKQRMEAIQNRKGPPKPGDDILLSVIGDGRKNAIDYRLIDPAAPKDNSKLETMIGNVARIWKESARQPLHAIGKDGYSDKPVDFGPATQMIFSDLGINGDFPVHKYISGSLQRLGVPKSQIAIISDYKSHVAKQRLFNDMNEGKVRILIGSVAKMGTGVNAQRRLYALHNMDPQWYPANDQQRNGRIIRQGNMNPEVEIYDYSTKGTYDSQMWQLMETKARFIEGFMRGDPTMRDMEDLGEASQYEQAKAMTTADPRVAQLTEWKQDLEKNLRRRSAFDRELQAVRSKIASSESYRDEARARIPHIEADIAARTEDYKGDAFTASADGKAFDVREEFGEAMLAHVDDLAGREGITKEGMQKIGRMGGFDIGVDFTHGDKGAPVARFYVLRDGGFETRVKDVSGARGLVTKIANILDGFEQELANAQDTIERMEKRIADYRPQLDRSFKGMTEIRELREKIGSMESTLAFESAKAQADVNGQASIPDLGEPVALLTGDEIAGDTISALREAATNWYKTNLIGRSATTSDGRNVSFSGRGLRKTTSKGEDLLRSVPAIRAIIERGKLIESRPGRDASTKAMHVYGGIVSIGGKEHHLGIMVRESINGTFHYDFTKLDGSAGSRSSLTDGASGDAVQFGITPGEINLFELSADGKLGSDLAEEATPDLTPVWDAALAQMERLGIANRVHLSLRDVVGNNRRLAGIYRSGVIEVALSSPQSPSFTISHEAIHALRDMGLFLPAEWTTLEKAARADAGMMASIRRRYPRLSEAAQIEEAIADRYARWSRGQQEKGFVAKAFERVRDFFRALGEALRGNGFTTAESVMRAVDAGRVGRRNSQETLDGSTASSRSDLDMSEQARQDRAIEQGFLTEAAWQELKNGGPTRSGMDRNAGTDRQYDDAGRGEGNRRTDARPAGDNAGNESATGERERGADTGGSGLSTFYHGTSDQIGAFALGHPNRKDAGWLGRGIYLTDDPRLARMYAQMKRGSGLEQVMELRLRLTHPFHATLKDKQRLRYYSESAINDWTDARIAEGYDGTILTYPDGTSEIAVFDPANIRGIDAAFDPDEAGSADLKASIPDSPAFDDVETESRFQAAKDGITSKESLRERVGEWLATGWHGMTRHWINLPNIPRYAALQQKLRAIEAAPQQAKERTIRLLDDMVKDFSKDDLDLFTRKVILDDLMWDAGNNRDLPFGFTPESVAREKVKIDTMVDAQPDKKVWKAAMKRKLASKAIAKELVAAGVLEAEQIKNPAYYRHQVLEYARAEQRRAHSAAGIGNRLRSPKWAKRMGSTLDINANLLEAEFDWLNKAFTDIPVARTIEWIKQSEHNILPDLKKQAQDSNAAGVKAKLAEAEGVLSDDRASDDEKSAAAELIQTEKMFRQHIAMGFDHVRQAIMSRQIDGIPKRFERTADAIAIGRSNTTEPPFQFLSWLLDENKAGAMGGAMIYKAISQRRVWTEKLLGKDYIDPNDAEALVKQLAPDGYRTWQPDEGKLLFTAKTLPEHVLDRMMELLDAPQGVDAAQFRAELEKGRNALMVGGDRYKMILPDEVADTLNQLKRVDLEGIYDFLVKAPLRAWKRWVLINPRRFIKYNLNNITGDLDAVIAGNPRALRHVSRAAKELATVMRGKADASERYIEAVDRGVFDSGVSVQEIPDLHTFAPFERFAKDGRTPTKIAMLPLRKAWGVLQGTTQWRENIIRYAAYLDYVERLEASEPQSSIGYGASIPAMVDAVPDIKDRAALLARDLVGDYGAISHFGGGLRNTVIPFWSWMEINTRRYWRLTSNAWSQGVGKGITTGTALGVAAGTRTTAMLAVRAGMVYGLIQLWNHMFFPDEEDDLDEQQKAQLHIILGRDDAGQVVTLRTQGAMSDALSWFGIGDTISAFKEYEKGRAPLADALLTPFKAPVNKIGTALAPTITLPFETASGKKFWPDLFNMRENRDPWRNILSSFSLDNEYDWAMSRPSRGYARSWVDAITYRRDPGEMAYNEARGLAYDWLRHAKGQSGSSSFSTPRSEALRDYRTALRFGDEDAASAAIDRMIDLGVNDKDLSASIKRAAPLGPIAKKDRAAFLDQLTDEELETFQKAEQWYQQTFLQ